MSTAGSIEKTVQPLEIHEDASDLLRILEKENLELKRTLNLKNNQLQKMKANLVQANKLATLGTMGADVAHELNNPLTVISAEADEILDAIVNGYQSDEQIEASVKNIKQCAERMRCLIDYIRQFIRRDEDAPWIKLDINAIIRDALLILKPQLKNHQIEIIENLLDNMPKIWGHKTRLESVFQNLLANARDAFEEVTDKRKKQIHIETTLHQDKWVTISVSDNACGIPDTLKTKIYEPFFTTKKAGKGTGLGLPMVLDIIKLHKGSIALDSQKNIGSHFTIRLPLERRSNDRREE